MQDLNDFKCTGRLTRDLELSYTPSQKAIGKGSVAINRKFNDVEKTTFVDFVVWEKAAEIMAQYTQKGSQLLLCGRFEQDSWEKDGKKYSKLILTVEDFKFLDKKDKE